MRVSPTTSTFNIANNPIEENINKNYWPEYSLCKEHIDDFETEEARQDYLKTKRDVIVDILNNHIPAGVTCEKQELLKNLNLTDVDCSHLDLSGLDLTKSILKRTNMTKTNLTNAILLSTSLDSIILEGANISNISVDVNQIRYLPLSDSEKYIQLSKEVKRHKTPSVDQQEMEAIGKFRESCDLGNPIQARFARLDDEQLQLLLPCIYVERNHRFDPIIAYNKQDRGARVKNMDDNVNMIRGYTCVLSHFNKIIENGNQIDQHIREGVFSLTEIFKYSKEIFITQSKIFKENQGWLYNIEGIKSKLENYQKPKELKNIFYDSKKLLLPKLDCYINIDLGISEEEAYLRFAKENSLEKTPNVKSDHIQDDIKESSLEKDEYRQIIFCGKIDRNQDVMEKSLEDFIHKLTVAFKNKDMVEIFNLTSELQYLHLFPNANGRISQIIRDCCAVHFGQMPFSALHSMSHYQHLITSNDIEHLTFMQKITEEVFCAVENKVLTAEVYRKNSLNARAELLKYSSENQNIEHDIDIFLKMLERREARMKKIDNYNNSLAIF